MQNPEIQEGRQARSMADCNVVELKWDEHCNRVVQYPRIRRSDFSKTKSSSYTDKTSTEKSDTKKSVVWPMRQVDPTISEILVKRLVPGEELFSERGQRRSCPSLESKVPRINQLNQILNGLKQKGVIQIEEAWNIDKASLDTAVNTYHPDAYQVNDMHNHDVMNDPISSSSRQYNITENYYKEDEAMPEGKTSTNEMQEVENTTLLSSKQDVDLTTKSLNKTTEEIYFERLFSCKEEINEQIMYSQAPSEAGNKIELMNQLVSTVKYLQSALRNKTIELEITRKKLDSSMFTGVRRLNSINDLRGIVRVLQSRLTENTEAQQLLEDSNHSLRTTVTENKTKITKYLKENFELLRQNGKLIETDICNRDLINTLERKVKFLETTTKRKDAEIRQLTEEGRQMTNNVSKKLNDQVKTALVKQQVQENKIEHLLKAIELLVQLSYEKRLHAFISAQRNPTIEQNISDITASHLMASYKRTAEEKLKQCLEEIKVLMDKTNFGESLGEYLFQYTASDFI